MMECWLINVKRVRIPRPKFDNNRCYLVQYPREPPKDYIYNDEDPIKIKQNSMNCTTNIDKNIVNFR